MDTKILSLHLSYDEDASHPLENSDWRVVSFSTKHSNYEDPDKYLRGSGRPEPKNIGLRRKMDAGAMFILSCYQHGGVQWGLRGETHQCDWDTADVAGLLIYEGKSKELPSGYYAREQMAREIIKTYTQWCNGEVYGFILSDGEEEISACWGYYEKDSIIDAITTEIEGKTVNINGPASYLINQSDLKPKETITI